MGSAKVVQTDAGGLVRLVRSDLIRVSPHFLLDSFLESLGLERSTTLALLAVPAVAWCMWPLRVFHAGGCTELQVTANDTLADVLQRVQTSPDDPVVLTGASVLVHPGPWRGSSTDSTDSTDKWKPQHNSWAAISGRDPSEVPVQQLGFWIQVRGRRRLDEYTQLVAQYEARYCGPPVAGPLACAADDVDEVDRVTHPKAEAEALLMVTTDRVSAFDMVLPNDVPGKGRILHQLSAFWEQQVCRDIATHTITNRHDYMRPHVQRFIQRHSLQRRCALVEKLRMLPVEVIVRGYLCGSAWEAYRTAPSGCHCLGGVELPRDLKCGDKLPTPIVTPTTKAKAGVEGAHDESITADRAAELVGGRHVYDALARIAVTVYERAADFAAQRGLVLLDTKFEFGLNSLGQVVLADELLTPDCSRYIDAQTGDSLSKQYLRDELQRQSHQSQQSQHQWIPLDVVRTLLSKYVELFHRLTDKWPQ
jgi:phosphoribosylaminoimidazole-succinocarboxamide synthase